MRGDKATSRKINKADHVVSLESEPQRTIRRMTNWQSTQWTRAKCPGGREPKVSKRLAHFAALNRADSRVGR